MLDPSALLRLARWLGPWTPDDRVPDAVAVRETGDRVRVRWFEPTGLRATRTIFIVPGVHYDGADDPRLDRLARVFARAGRAVAVPFLEDYLELRVAASVCDDAKSAFEHVLADPRRPADDPLLFSISFGSLPAFHIAGSDLGERVRAMVAFGGYGDWPAAVEFALTGRDEIHGGTHAADPLNKPVVAANLCRDIPDFAPHEAVLVPAWKAFCEATWGRPPMRLAENYTPVAEQLAATLEPEARAPFLIGCGVLPGLPERSRHALAVGSWDHLDPSGVIAGIRCPLHVFHGADDDVICDSQVDAILAHAPKGRASGYRTGLYGHTGSESVHPAAVARELVTMVRMLVALSS